MASLELFCSCAPEITDLMSVEAASLGAVQIHEVGAGVECIGTLETAYRLCLWSRLANKVYIILTRSTIGSPSAPHPRSSGQRDHRRKARPGAGEARDHRDEPSGSPEELYDLAGRIRWADHFSVDSTFAVYTTMTASNLCPPNYAALKVKDAIADQFRDSVGRRPSVDTNRPDFAVHLHIQRNRVSIGIDLAGESLHRRGYRIDGTESMLKETVAASMLVRAGWPEFAAAGAPFIDPMCGSGTLPIEAAFIAGDRAPGLERVSYGFAGWLAHDPKLFERIRSEARDRWTEGKRRLPIITASDINPTAIRATSSNATRAGLQEAITLHVRPIEELAIDPGMRSPGFVAVDPPYGVRSETGIDLAPLYRTIGDTIKSRLPGWRGALLSADPELSKTTGLWAKKTNVLHNGRLKCLLAVFEIFERTAPRAVVDETEEDDAAAGAKATKDDTAAGVKADAATDATNADTAAGAKADAATDADAAKADAAAGAKDGAAAGV